jgi:hypothetical protein
LTGRIKIFPNQKRVQLPRLGQLRVKESPVLPPTARTLSATVSRTANKWYIAFTVEEDRPIPEKGYDKVLGLDQDWLVLLPCLQEFLSLNLSFCLNA